MFVCFVFVCLFLGAIAARYNSYYGSGLPDVNFATSYIYCRGTEPQLYNCSGMHPVVRNPSSSCRSTDVAGVQCVGEHVCVSERERVENTVLHAQFFLLFFVLFVLFLFVCCCFFPMGII